MSEKVEKTDAEKAAAAAAKAKKVFETAELLEAVLLQFDEKTLLLAQRINKSFQSAIKNSVHLQRKLYFQPSPTETDAPLEVNPLVFRIGDPPSNYNVWCEFTSYPDALMNNRFVTMKVTQWDEVYAAPRSGSWRDMLVAKDGREFSCQFEVWPFARFGSRTFKNCKKGITAGELADWIEEAAELGY